MKQELELTSNKGQVVGYVRVSTENQNPERQLNGYPVDKLFTDYASGKDTDRVQLKAMLNYVRDNDTVVVHSMDRLARNVEDLLTMVRYLNRNNVKIKFLKENLTFEGNNSPISIMFLTVIGAVSEFERCIIRERTAEGIAIAKKKGLFKGRKPALSAEQILILEEKLDLKFPVKKLKQMFGVSLPTIYKYINIIEKKNGVTYEQVTIKRSNNDRDGQVV